MGLDCFFIIGHYRGEGFVICIVRLGALDHSHEDPSQGRACGRLRFGLFPYVISNPSNPQSAPLSLPDEQNDSTAPAKEQTSLPSFPSPLSAGRYISNHWQELTKTHDMAAPRDEWRVNMAGHGELYISVERIFHSEYDSDDTSSEEKSHCFIDVLDIVMRKYTDEEIKHKQREHIRREHRQRKHRRREQRRREYLQREHLPKIAAEENEDVEGKAKADNELVYPPERDGTAIAVNEDIQQRTTLRKDISRATKDVTSAADQSLARRVAKATGRKRLQMTRSKTQKPARPNQNCPRTPGNCPPAS
ncbi:hypothetical protein HD806DRAFT_351430 [Xylariaceae sp. AK1471]|nr:hypothetical protein HD806DRAFT_351430 [Xylariaceae sp. AK1471]